MDARIRLVMPQLGVEELAEVSGVFDSGTLTQGPRVAAFEEQVAERVGASFAVATTSATTALHLAVVALGLHSDDEVLVPDFTFPATANIVVQQGARPVLCDVDVNTFSMDPDALVSKITPRTKGIIPVHAFGLSADMDPILEIAREHGLWVVEDAACAIGSTYRGAPCGSLSDAACFSFHPRKAITTGEGGMVTTKDPELAERLRILRNHGGVRNSGRFTFEAAGFNYRLSDILAAIGIAQLRRLDAFVAEKRRLAARYRSLLAEEDLVALPVEPDWATHVYQSFVVRLDERVDRDSTIRAMNEKGIETTIGTYALHAEPYFRKAFGYVPGDLPRSYRLVRSTLTLPCYPGLGDEGVERVAQGLIEVLHG